MAGRTSVTGLFAVGEAASTGVHGANRLASNSLTEALIAGRRVGDLLGRSLPRLDPGRPVTLRPLPAAPGVSPAVRPALAAGMSRYAGVARDRNGLERLLGMLEQAPPAGDRLDVAVVEATSLHTVSLLVAVAALARAESRGCHRWRDVPPTRADGARHTVLVNVAGRPVIAGPVLAAAGASA
jgi:L-aspartate oxidase